MRNRGLPTLDPVRPTGTYRELVGPKNVETWATVFGAIWSCLVLFGPKKMLRAFVPIRVQIQNDELS